MGNEVAPSDHVVLVHYYNDGSYQFDIACAPMVLDHIYVENQSFKFLDLYNDQSLDLISFQSCLNCKTELKFFIQNNSPSLKLIDIPAGFFNLGHLSSSLLKPIS